ncbi:WYL domain-containing protein [Flavobacteriaceae bacterium TK19130]|nr:WYL domain-containing protein [Thermobacterium salinum]
MNTEIKDAIRNQNLIEFNYDGGSRTVEPHCYGITTAGNEGLRAYQVDGYSSSGRMGWKMFDLGKASSINVLAETFESPRPGYKKGDRGMDHIYQEV